MAWKRRSTFNRVEVEAELNDFDTDQLLQALIDRRLITEAEAERVLSREGDAIAPTYGLIADELALARHEIYVGRRDEALIHLERALGSPFVGRLV